MANLLRYGDEFLIRYSGHNRKRLSANQPRSTENTSVTGVIVGMG